MNDKKHTQEKEPTNLIKQRLEEIGLTQKELAELSGITISAIRDYVNYGVMPKLNYAIKLAKVLNLSLNDLAVVFNLDISDLPKESLLKATPAELASNYSLEELADAMSIAAKKTTHRTKIAA